MLINLNNVTILNTQMAFQLFFGLTIYQYHIVEFSILFCDTVGGSFRVINYSLDLSVSR